MIRAVPALAVAALMAAHSAHCESGPRYRDSKSQAMGLTGTASAEGAASLFLNPAALAKVKPETGGMGFSLDLGVNPEFVEYASWADDNDEHLDDMDSLLAHIGSLDGKWASLSQSSIVYGNWQGVAFAALLEERYDLTVGKAVITPVPGVGALSDLVLTAGQGFQAGEGYRYGFALKYIYRLRFERRLVGTTDEEFYTVKAAWEDPDDGWSDWLAKVKVANEVAEVRQGVGLNLGAEKDVGDNWTAGLSLLDFPTVIERRFVRPDLNLGLNFHSGVDLIPELAERLTVNLDWQRFLIPGTPWLKQLKAGVAMEGSIRKRPVAYVAMGLNDGYPTFGFRLGYVLYLSYVYVAEELGTYPGQEKLEFHKLAVQLDF